MRHAGAHLFHSDGQMRRTNKTAITVATRKVANASKTHRLTKGAGLI